MLKQIPSSWEWKQRLTRTDLYHSDFELIFVLWVEKLSNYFEYASSILRHTLIDLDMAVQQNYWFDSNLHHNRSYHKNFSTVQWLLRQSESDLNPVFQDSFQFFRLKPKWWENKLFVWITKLFCIFFTILFKFPYCFISF